MKRDALLRELAAEHPPGAYDRAGVMNKLVSDARALLAQDDERSVPMPFLMLVLKLRKSQKLFFETRNATVLQECKVTERQVDDQLDALLNPNRPKQGTMFQ